MWSVKTPAAFGGCLSRCKQSLFVKLFLNRSSVEEADKMSRLRAQGRSALAGICCLRRLTLNCWVLKASIMGLQDCWPRGCDWLAI